MQARVLRAHTRTCTPAHTHTLTRAHTLTHVCTCPRTRAQYRPPVRQTTVELPAGLIDKNETAEAAALRELREETGFVGSILHVSGEVCMSPGICDETVRIVVVDVDLTRPENQNPEQELDEGEYCVVRRVPLSELRELLSSSSHMSIEGIMLFAWGIELGLGLVER